METPLSLSSIPIVKVENRSFFDVQYIPTVVHLFVGFPVGFRVFCFILQAGKYNLVLCQKMSFLEKQKS